jgi:methanogenic corrinoid protein MtbC1
MIVRELTANGNLLESPFSQIAVPYLEALLAADRIRAQQIITDALGEGLAIRDLYLGVFQPVQHEVGRLWLINKVSVAEEHFCTAATQTIMSDLYPQIISSKRIGRTMVAACVGSELHEIGIRMVADFFEMEGWDTYYIGAGISHNHILSVIEQQKPDLLALSATMTHHIQKVLELISVIRSTFTVVSPRIMVGGMPFNNSPELWRTVGADLWASDAAQAVQLAQQITATPR